MTTDMTTAPPDTAPVPVTSPRRLTKGERVALKAIDIAAALPGKWTIGRGRHDGEVADLRCLNTGLSIGFYVVEQRACAYTLGPGEVPTELLGDFVWQAGGEKNPSPDFAVGTPATEVAAFIHEQLIPYFSERLARAQTAKRERSEARAREYAARTRLVAQLKSVFPTATDRNPRWPEWVRIHYLGFDDLMQINLTMPIDDAVAFVPRLAQAMEETEARNAADRTHGNLAAELRR